MNCKFENVKRCHHESVGVGALCSWKVDNDTMKRARQHEHVSKNGYFWNILMIGTKSFRISLCHVRMMWKIFFHMYMDESHKMDEKFG
jgi:hypothetical protein